MFQPAPLTHPALRSTRPSVARRVSFELPHHASVVASHSFASTHVSAAQFEARSREAGHPCSLTSPRLHSLFSVLVLAILTSARFLLPYVDDAVRATFLPRWLLSVHSCAHSIVSTSAISCFCFFDSVEITIDPRNPQSMTLTTKRTLKYFEKNVHVSKMDAWRATSVYDELGEVKTGIGVVQEGWRLGGCGQAHFNAL